MLAKAGFNQLFNEIVYTSFAESAPTTMNDPELVKRIRRGQTLAMELLHDRYAARLLTLALRISGDQAAAEEAVRETFLGLWNRDDSLPAEAVSAWLAASVRDHSLAPLRRRSEARFQHWQVLAQLPDEQQNVILLSFAGYNWREIATQVNCPESKVAALARLALQTLSATITTR